jgi:hypothetical protein
MVPGFRVWLYYNKETDVFGTFVTQGDAKINPNKLARLANQRRTDAAYSDGYEEGMRAGQSQRTAVPDSIR